VAFVTFLIDYLQPEYLARFQFLHDMLADVHSSQKVDMSLGGYRVPAGTSIMRLGQVTSNLEKHFQDSAKFIPERWMR
jgi:hypothetical protein